MPIEDYYVVGERCDGSRLVLATAAGPEQAERVRARLAGHVEGYRALTVERAEGLTEYDRKPRAKGDDLCGLIRATSTASAATAAARSR